MTGATWVSWNGAKLAHAAPASMTASDVRNGSFPLSCGRWAPDGWDKDVELSHKPRCFKCSKITATNGGAS